MTRLETALVFGYLGGVLAVAVVALGKMHQRLMNGREASAGSVALLTLAWPLLLGYLGCVMIYARFLAWRASVRGSR